MTVSFPSSFNKSDVNFASIDLDDEYVTEPWLIEQFVGNTLLACGYNPQGQIGNGSVFVNYSSPTQVGNISNWRQISTSISTSFGIRADNTLWSWGANNVGQLGIGNIVYYSSPVQVGSLNNWKQVSAGQTHTAAIKTDGTLWVWGQNNFGQLGNNALTTVTYSSPIQVGSLNNWKQVAAGSTMTYAIMQDGTLWAWGSNNVGEIPNGSLSFYSSPIQIGSLTNWRYIATIPQSGYAIKTDGTLWSWGANSSGQLGNNSISSYSSPIQVGSMTNWRYIATNSNGAAHMVGIKTDGTMWSWGNNTSGNLGNGTTSNYSSPVQVGNSTDWKQVSIGNQYTVAVKSDGTLWSWGTNSKGQAGVPSTGVYYQSPIQVGSLANWKQVSCGNQTTLFINFADIS